jgi:hypothetical protein
MHDGAFAGALIVSVHVTLQLAAAYDENVTLDNRSDFWPAMQKRRHIGHAQGT